MIPIVREEPQRRSALRAATWLRTPSRNLAPHSEPQRLRTPSLCPLPNPLACDLLQRGRIARAGNDPPDQAEPHQGVRTHAESRWERQPGPGKWGDPRRSHAGVTLPAGAARRRTTGQSTHRRGKNVPGCPPQGLVRHLRRNRHQPRAGRSLHLEHLQGIHRRVHPGRRGRCLRLGPCQAERSVCRCLPGVCLRHDPGRQVPGQVRAQDHRHDGRDSRGPGVRVDLPDHQLCRMGPGFRCAGRDGDRLRLLRRNAAGPEVVPRRQDGAHRGSRGLGVRPRLPLHRPPVPIPARHRGAATLHDDLRRGVPPGGGSSVHAPGQSPQGVRPGG
jgi:hypothetical protein